MYTICFLLIFEFVVADLDCPGGQASACDPEPAQPEGGMSWLLTVVPVSQPASQLASPARKGEVLAARSSDGTLGRRQGEEGLHNRLEHKINLALIK